MDSKVNVLEEVFDCLNNNRNFVLQGGAGSGKTESLKRVLEYISDNYPEKSVACITHTNLAVDEIISRVDEEYTICTIHSFVNGLIKNYKKNLHSVIGEIFKLETVRNVDHKEYKRLYQKYAARLYTVRNKSVSKVIGKRLYESDAQKYNEELNICIDDLNKEIDEIIAGQDYNNVGYNETRFDSFMDLTYGHDSLLKIASLLFSRFPLISKIVCDKYDFIFIDEYQDTNEEIVDILLRIIPDESITTIGLFGDSMQGIYEDGVGDVDKFIDNKDLIKIEKEDNYRCSQQVIDFINKLRNDGLKQEVALKMKDGSYESISDRQGKVELYYSIYTGETTTSGNPKDREEYLEYVNTVIRKVEECNPNYKKLMLTNKSISKELDFENLYRVFDLRYSDVKEEIEKELTKLQLIDLAIIVKEYEEQNYNYVISELKKGGYVISSLADKEKISHLFSDIITSDKSAIDVLRIAFENQLMKKSDSYISYVERKDVFLSEIENDGMYVEFRRIYCEGNKTYTKMNKCFELQSEEQFKEFERMYKRERFYKNLFSDLIKFSEVMSYLSYLNEEADYITMHKTKGSGINNVMVIMEEYFWYMYKFRTIYDNQESDMKKKLRNQKLFYVACSRAISNLVCVKVILRDEEKDLLELFGDNVVKV